MKATLAFGFAAITLCAPAYAQCLLPDGLNGPCCTPTVSTLPNFPAYQMPGLAISFIQCAPALLPCIRWDFGAPTPASCDQFKANVQVLDCNPGNVQLTGSVILDYTRTWEEISPLGPIQVWRFAAKADLSHPASVPANPGIVPPSLAAFPQVFYYGYIDYALDCNTGTWEMAAVLHHQCDWFIHGNPAFSSTPGVQHPGRSFSLIGPNTAANPFVPILGAAPGGGVVGEGTRTSSIPGAVCSTEEPLQGIMQLLAQACLCAIAPQPPQLTARRLNTVGACGTTVTTLDTLGAGLPWLHLMTTRIGAWTTTANYPGPERVWVDEGPVLYREGCVGSTGVVALSVDVMYGGSTSQGYPTILPSGLPGFVSMTDLASNYSWLLGTPLPLPIYGNVQPTRHLVYVTLP